MGNKTCSTQVALTLMDTALQNKYQKLQCILRKAGRLAVAFSGGVDSTLLLHTAAAVLGDDAVAIHARSDLSLPGEFNEVKELAARIGCTLLVLPIDPLSWHEFTKNPADRCYHCKKKILGLFQEKLALEGDFQLVDGTNADDLSTDRPGLRALEELGVTSPLAQAGLSKEEIRELSYWAKLPTWDRPAASCLATRIPTGTAISREQIALVGRLEKYLHSLGFLGCRVRLESGNVKIELVAGDFEKFANQGLRAKILRFFSDSGVKKVFVDLSERPKIQSFST